jgi:dihydrofolate reductase
MPKLRANNLSISIDGYLAGPDQSVETPLGIGGEELHSWVVATQGWRAAHGMEGGTTGIDNDFAARGDVNIGATIMGRNMFGPVRGRWPDAEWRGWWGDDPPYHHPVFVLTHHARDPIPMQGGTTFYFVTDGVEAALERAIEAARGKDVRLGGGADTVRQYLEAGLVDEMHLAIAPVLLNGGERLLETGTARAYRAYEVAEFTPSPSVMHVVLTRRPARRSANLAVN